ncbi:DUF4360 domain-containing protein [Actinomadura sp. KC06]|uniref:DUF4360 domain-containing protein n=1 Tax=Actinomadura sp. KC06 TaxID=2530369 RepID=UPI00104317E0|nr:DUF4360 domain-containing protein [Actinomadura sp. KC06]TDD31936.1 DUF4360 domain-containing protein [Actinomadura sp. KC06]
MRKGMAISAAAAALAMTATTVTPAAASEEFLGRGPEGVTIEVATVNGSGCPIGTAAIALNETNDAFTVTYSQYIAQAGGSSKPTDGRKNCQINMRVHVPQGFTYAVSSTDYRGYASLQPGASATQLASYYFQGDERTREFSHNLAGPYKKNWQTKDVVDVSQLVWSPCGEQRNFNVNTELRAEEGTDGSKVSFIGMDSTDGSIKTTYHYSWKRCQ